MRFDQAIVMLDAAAEISAASTPDAPARGAAGQPQRITSIDQLYSFIGQQQGQGGRR